MCYNKACEVKLRRWMKIIGCLRRRTILSFERSRRNEYYFTIVLSYTRSMLWQCIHIHAYFDYHSISSSVQLCTGRSRLHLPGLTPRSSLVTTTTLTTSEKHATHHIQQRVSLSRDLDIEIHFSDTRQRIIPDTNLFYMRGVMPRQIPK